jgi:hypothetical protein
MKKTIALLGLLLISGMASAAAPLRELEITKIPF